MRVCSSTETFPRGKCIALSSRNASSQLCVGGSTDSRAVSGGEADEARGGVMELEAAPAIIHLHPITSAMTVMQSRILCIGECAAEATEE